MYTKLCTQYIHAACLHLHILFLRGSICGFYTYTGKGVVLAPYVMGVQCMYILLYMSVLVNIVLIQRDITARV